MILLSSQGLSGQDSCRQPVILIVAEHPSGALVLTHTESMG